MAPHCFLRMCIVPLLILALLVMAPGELSAIQIAPNPNPSGNTITITPSTPGENCVPFTNLSRINIEPLASFQNSSEFNNGRFRGYLQGSTVINSGTIINSDHFNNAGSVSMLEGSRFINLPSGVYVEIDGATSISGMFLNEGRTGHSSSDVRINETGQYIQRQSASSSVTPTTVNVTAVRNAGLVHIAAGEFSNGVFGRYAQTGTTQIDGVFKNGGGFVFNDGQFTVGKTGLYEHQRAFALPIPGVGNPGGSALNNRAFTNAGTTNIATGVFTNQGSVVNSGTFSVGTLGTYSQTSTAAVVTPTTVNSGTFTNAGMARIGEGTIFSNTLGIEARGAYVQQGTGTTQIDGTFSNNSGGRVTNDGGAVTVRAFGTYEQVGLASTTTNSGTFTNGGVVRIGEGTFFGNNRDTPFSTPAAVGVYITEAGRGTLIDGTFDNRGSVWNEGTIAVRTTGTYTQSPSSSGLAATTRNASTFQNEGRVSLSGSSSFFNTSQYIQLASGTTGIGGTLVNLSGLVFNAGTITVGTRGEYIQNRLPLPGDRLPTTLNIGTFTNAGNTLINGGIFTNQGSVVNSGTWQIAPHGTATFANQGSTVNSGIFEVATRGQVTGNGSYLQNAAGAQTIVNGTFAHTISLQAGSLSGTGIITGTVTNTGGVVQPGTSLVPGTLTLANYTQGNYGRLDLKIGGLLAGSQYDVLKVTGPATFGGNLSVRLINGFTPGVGNTFNLLACSLGCAGLNGGSLFSGGLSLPSLASGLAWLSGLTDGGNGFSLTVVAAAASAPEPGTLVLIASGFLGLVMWRRRQSAIMPGNQCAPPVAESTERCWGRTADR